MAAKSHLIKCAYRWTVVVSTIHLTSLNIGWSKRISCFNDSTEQQPLTDLTNNSKIKQRQKLTEFNCWKYSNALTDLSNIIQKTKISISFLFFFFFYFLHISKKLLSFLPHTLLRQSFGAKYQWKIQFRLTLVLKSKKLPSSSKLNLYSSKQNSRFCLAFCFFYSLNFI